MPPKRDSDILDDSTVATTPATDSSAVAGGTRSSKKRKTQAGKSADDGQAGGSDVENVPLPGAPTTPLAGASTTPLTGAPTTPPRDASLTGAPTTPPRTQAVSVLGSSNGSNGDSVTSPESDNSPVARGGSTGAPATSPPLITPAMVEYKTLSWYPVTLDRRLRGILTYQKPSEGIYSLSLFPETEVAWGQTDNLSHKLCMRGTTTPIVIWIVGSVTSVWFYDQSGDPHNKVSIGVAPLTMDAMNRGRRILSHLSRPPQNIEAWSTHLSASRWQTMRIPKRRDVAVVPFDRCYNATDRYENKANMPILPIEDVKINDLVLVEVNVARYSTSKKDSNASGGTQRTGKDRYKQRTTFTEWKPTFDLLCVSLLCAAPDDPTDTASADAPDAGVAF